ncbi:MAG TPA: hypothetical protein VFF06_34795 [Polyangia bacterium]|nr:hypothetical protein [Polyangia bacterium]
MRADAGVVPDSFVVFSYLTDVPGGRIVVTRRDDVAARALFGAEYGYVKARAHNRDELDAWLRSIDEVTHVAAVDGALELGGRRFADHRTLGVTLDDVAVLYKANQVAVANAKVLKEKQDAKQQKLDPVDKTFVELIAVLKREMERNRLDVVAFTVALRKAEAATNRARRAYDLPEHSEAAAVDLASPEGQLAAFRSLSDAGSEVKAVADGKFELDTMKNPPTAGFSLDPRWDNHRLGQELEALLHNPQPLIAEALALDAGLRESADGGQLSKAMQEAHFLAAVFKDVAPESFRIPPRWRAPIAEVAKVLTTARADDEDAAVAFLSLDNRLKESLLSVRAPGRVGRTEVVSPQDETMEAVETQLRRLLLFIGGKHRFQCARYDATPIQGTAVAMTLYYTDLLAKIWSLDYASSTPSAVVHGFVSLPAINRVVEPIYYDGLKQLDRTRLWFGPRSDAASYSADRSSLDFQTIASRVYAKGSNSLLPKKEEAAAEDSRRVLTWWDRHFAAVADYEPQYHRQNQIMKWSIITNWMIQKNLARYLAHEPPPKEKLQFDEWMKSERKRLAFSGDVHFRPRSSWVDGRECLDLLSSKPFLRGRSAVVSSGGVSLASAEEAAALPKVAAELSADTRRGWIASIANEDVHSVNGATYRLPSSAAAAGKVKITPREGDALIQEGAKLRTASIETEARAGNGRASVAIKTPIGPVGELTYERGGGGAADRLGVRDGVLLEKKELLERTSGEADDLLTRPNTFFLANKNGVEVIELATGNGKAPARLVRVLPAKDALSADWMMMNASGTRVGVESIAAAQAQQKLNQLPWQVLSKHPDGSRVMRAFTSAAPHAGATPITLTTADPALATVQGFFDGDALFLQRPAGGAAAQRAFNELVDERAITADVLQELQHAPGQPVATSKLSVSSVRAAVDRISAAAPQQRDAELVDALTRLKLDPDPNGVDARALLAVAALQKPELAAAAMLDELAAAKGSAVLDVAPRALDGVAADVAAAKLGRSGAKAPVIDAVGVARSGRRLHATADIGRGLAGATHLTQVQDLPSALHTVQAEGAVAYVEDSGPLNRFDWDGNPVGSYADATKTPGVIVEAGDFDDFGTFRPSEFIKGKKLLMRREIPAAVEPAPVDRSRARLFYVVRSPHDCNDDVEHKTASERAACAEKK